MTGSVSGERSGAIDAVRVLGILAVVAGHTLATPLVRPLLYTWHVPLFFFLAGYFWSSRRSPGEELGTRARTLVRPYLTWFVLSGVVFLLLDPLRESNSWERLLLPLGDGRASAMPFTTFWFVSVLFVCCVLLRLLWAAPRGVVWVVAIACAVAGWLFGPQLAGTPLSLAAALPCLLFVLLGWAARRWQRLIPRGHRGSAALIALVALGGCAAVIATDAAEPIDVKAGDFGTPVLSALTAVVIACALVLIAQWLFARLPARASAIATELSYGGLMVVLVHPLVLWLLLRFGPSLPSWAVFAACATLSWLAALLALRLPWSSWVTGAPRRRVAVLGYST